MPTTTTTTTTTTTDIHRSSTTDNDNGNDAISSSVIIPPRSFNHLVFDSDTVTKTSSSPALIGELFFYRNIPSSLSFLFPTLLHHVDTPTTLTITRVPGITLSTLLTTGRLKPVHVRAVLQRLHTMHAWKRCEHGGLLYMNHGAKVMSRLKRWKKIYEDVGLSNDVHFRPLLESLNMYERNQNAVPAGVIHGDPVLTNIILHASSSSGHDKTDDEEEEEQVELKFIDMRGAQGNHLTLAGDAIYDLAKVFQSLLGYDFILGDVPFTSHAVDTLADLVNVFWKTVAQLYPSVQPKHILTVCAGLVTSLIPLHDNERHRARFAVIATELLRALQEEEEEVVVGNTMTMMTNGMQLSKSRDNSINKKGTVTTLLYAIAHQVDACA